MFFDYKPSLCKGKTKAQTIPQVQKTVAEALVQTSKLELLSCDDYDKIDLRGNLINEKIK